MFSAPVNVVLKIIFEKILAQPTSSEIEEQEAIASNRQESVASQGQVGFSKHPQKKSRRTVFSSSTHIQDDLVTLSNEAFETAIHAHVIEQVPLRVDDDRPEEILQVPDIDRLISNLRKHERSLRGRELARFRAQWPVLQESNRACDDAVDAIAREMDAVEMESRESIRKLKKESSSYIGVKILDLFLLDLVGRSSRKAKIFERQSNAFKNEMVITWGVKGLALAFLLLINLYFIFSCMLYGRDKGTSWQRGWLIASMANLFVDVMVNKVMIVLIVYFFIPNAIFETVHVVKRTIRSTIEKMCKKTGGQKSADDKAAFSAPEYLFVSNRVAKAFPGTLESTLVLSYQSLAVSAEQSRLWKMTVEDDKDSRANLSLSLPLFLALNNLLLYVGSQAIPVQSVLVSCFNPLIVALMAFTGSAIMHTKILGIPIGFGIVFVVVLLFFYWLHSQYDPFKTDNFLQAESAKGAYAVAPLVTYKQTQNAKTVPADIIVQGNDHASYIGDEGDDHDHENYNFDEDGCSIDISEAELLACIHIDNSASDEHPAVEIEDNLSLAKLMPESDVEHSADFDISLNDSSIERNNRESRHIVPVSLDQLSLPPSAARSDSADGLEVDLSLCASSAARDCEDHQNVIPIGLDQLSLPSSVSQPNSYSQESYQQFNAFALPSDPFEMEHDDTPCHVVTQSRVRVVDEVVDINLEDLSFSSSLAALMEASESDDASPHNSWFGDYQCD